jgi:hypothetical protein
MIAGFADGERHALRQRPVEAGREIVEHDHTFARVDERVHHMASDIAGAAGNQDRHATVRSHAVPWPINIR